MATNLNKNRRFKEGNKVKIYYAPRFEGYSSEITDTTAGGLFQIVVTFVADLTPEIINVGDVCALSFGAGVISAKSQYTLTVDFPNSMFPDTDIMRFVGTEVQHIYVFSTTDINRRLEDMQVDRYIEEIEQATFGFMKATYNLQTKATLKLAPIRRVDEGKLAQALISKGFVLESCDTEDYDNDISTWVSDFPIELSGSSIDPIHRRAYLKQRKIESKSHRAKSTMEFLLIG